VKEETDLTDSSITILNPIEGVESWKEESRNLFFPAIAAMCRQEVFEKFKSNYSSKDVKASRFGSISLGSVLMSKEPTDNMKNEDYIWLVGDFELRQNYLLEYGKTKGSSLPRGYVFLQGAKIRRHPRIENALQLEFHHRHSTRIKCRVVIRLKSSIEEKRWMTCLQEASHLKIEDLYEFDISEGAKVLGTGRYATIRPARRRKLINNNNSPLHSSLRHPSVGENSYGNENGILKKKPSFSSFPNLHLLAQQEYNECALKIIDKNLYWQHVKRGTERVDTIVRETCVQADLIAHSKDHKGFVGLRSFFETQDKVVLELELLEGTDLYEYIRKKRPLAEKEAAHIMYDILGCMDVMKKLGIAHRDLKPANILMANKPNPYGMHVKVGDFGNATFVGEDNLVRGRCGTVGYVAPEILLAQKNSGYKNKVDEFSAGVILYVLLCGYEPFFGEDERELTAVNTKAKVEFPEEDWLSSKYIKGICIDMSCPFFISSSQ
jgi:tRNA A-37 threonylcarbamoyl transferase component Bud32